MEQLPERTSSNAEHLARTDQRVAADHQLPVAGNKLERITQHGKGLFGDLTSWIDLKIKLTKLEIQEELNEKKKEIGALVIAGVLAAIGGLFGLVTLGIGIGALFIWIGLSHPLSYTLGFLVVTLILLGAAAWFKKAGPDLLDEGKVKVAVDEDHLSPYAPTGAPKPPTPTN